MKFWKLLVQADEIDRFTSGKFWFKHQTNSWPVVP